MRPNLPWQIFSEKLTRHLNVIVLLTTILEVYKSREKDTPT